MNKTTPHLRPLTTTDIDRDLVQQLFTQPSTARFWFHPPFQNPKAAAKFVKKHSQSNRIISMVIQAPVADDLTEVGLIELVELDSIARTGELEITLLDQFQGKGYAQIAFAQMIDFLFTYHNLHKIFLLVDVDNAPAIHIYQKQGFTIEGTIKDQFFASGAYHNVYYMGLTQKQYHKITAD
ncbi:Spermidine N1-acetyltransferase [Fructilactobacillus florum 8D]|uniref:Spermidine N1-acetyltransferase n=1 Tax=Fructilactobacillus florum 8D TaxID=1221538 RepID=W9EEZ2_9LACO|nr:GNAT family N-acetyltransferase [Fructilactobacillus florum]EKK21113.1 Spermidine N1-acetyltransferase [Fructilactobacillus florum 2F]ETO40703.1 Spermidine N1-acetyltransferase [Fructilactobacillus florum 8D]